MMPFTRADTSILGQWWWTVDRWSLAAIAALMAFGALLAAASSPAVAERIGLDEFYFIKRHFMLLPVAIAMILAVSAMTPTQVRRMAVIAFLGCIVLLTATLLFGIEIKGARRWLSIAGFSLQATEFVKPMFAVVAAWLFSEAAHDPRFPGRLICTALFATVIALVIAQPDLGQAVVITGVWMAQFFLAGLPMWLVAGLVVLGVSGLVGSYFTLSHVASRIDRFIDPKQILFLADDSMIAAASFFQSIQMAFQLGGMTECGAIDPGQTVAVGISVPVGTGHAQQLEGSDTTGARQVRTLA